MTNPNEVLTMHEAQITLYRDPKQVLAEASRAADHLMEFVNKKKMAMSFGAKQHLYFEAWQMLGKFYGLTPRVVDDSAVDYGGVRGFECTAEVVNEDGRVLTRAKSMCLNDEDNWSTRTKYEWVDCTDPDGKKIWDDKKGRYKQEKKKVADVPVPMFQLRSMAQTRACAKALRNVLAWVVVLAGYAPTPAEEITGTESTDEPTPKPKMPGAKPAEEKPEATNCAAPFPAGYIRLEAKRDGLCKGCGKEVKTGSVIAYAKEKGTFHPDCAI
jgi:hypothetical protein